MIDLSKEYRTRLGSEVKLFQNPQLNAGFGFGGVVICKQGDTEYITRRWWNSEGCCSSGNRNYDLREVKELPGMRVLVYNALTDSLFLRGEGYTHAEPHFRTFRLDFESMTIKETDQGVHESE